MKNGTEFRRISGQSTESNDGKQQILRKELASHPPGGLLGREDGMANVQSNVDEGLQNASQ